VIGGNLGDDKINVFFDADDTVNGLTVNGGEGNDTITSDYRTPAAKALNIAGTGAGIVFDLGAGNDSVDASGRNDTIDGGAGDDTIAGRRGADTMTGGLGKNIFVIDGGTGTTPFSAKAETIVGTATVGNTDAILDWKADTSNTSVANNNGDILDVTASSFVRAGLYATLEEAIKQNSTADQVTLVGVGSGGSVTAFALINNSAASAAAAVDDVGAVQLGGVGDYNSTNFVTAMTQYQIV
jgi:Ca2+-binding RTX toxin-like protein